MSIKHRLYVPKQHLRCSKTGFHFLFIFMQNRMIHICFWLGTDRGRVQSDWPLTQETVTLPTVRPVWERLLGLTAHLGNVVDILVCRTAQQNNTGGGLLLGIVSVRAVTEVNDRWQMFDKNLLTVPSAFCHNTRYLSPTTDTILVYVQHRNNTVLTCVPFNTVKSLQENDDCSNR